MPLVLHYVDISAKLYSNSREKWLQAATKVLQLTAASKWQEYLFKWLSHTFKALEIIEGADQGALQHTRSETGMFIKLGWESHGTLTTSTLRCRQKPKSTRIHSQQSSKWGGGGRDVIKGSNRQIKIFWWLLLSRVSVASQRICGVSTEKTPNKCG